MCYHYPSEINSKAAFVVANLVSDTTFNSQLISHTLHILDYSILSEVIFSGLTFGYRLHKSPLR